MLFDASRISCIHAGNAKVEQVAISQPIAVLDIHLAGSGDADVYVAIGAPPSVESYDWRLYGATTNERGTLAVRKGDVVHVMVHGYGPRSEYDLLVRSV